MPKHAAKLFIALTATITLATACGSEEPEAIVATEVGAEINGGKPIVQAPEGPIPTALEVEDVVVGEGQEVAEGDFLVMHYVGVRHSDGGQFDASWDRGETFSFIIGGGQVIQGWDEGIVGMREGGRRVLSIPPEQAYGTQSPSPDIPAGSALVFVVDLLDVATPPTVANALSPVTELEVTVVEEGQGEVIETGSIVDIHYRAVLQTTGEVFDSSWEARNPVSFEVGAIPSQAIPAWDEALVGRRVGDSLRLVIPPELGLQDTTGAIPADATIITELTVLGVN